MSRLIKHTFLKDFFKNGIVSPKHAYICGLYVSDGSSANTAICWELKYPEHYLLTKICNELNGTQRTTFKVRNGAHGKKYISCKIFFHSKTFANNLNLLCQCEVGNKATSLNGLYHLENEYIRYLMLGIIDGDGCWGLNDCNGTMFMKIAASSLNFMKWCKEVISQHVSNKRRSKLIHKNRQYFVFGYQGTEDVYTVSKWLYKDIHKLDGLYCKRKYERVQLIQYCVENNLKPKDRQELFKIHKFNENLTEKNELYRLITMCKGNIPKPYNIHFSPSFVNFSNDFIV